MKHIFFIVHIFAFVLGVLCISLSYLVYRRNKISIAKVYSIFMLSLTLVLLEQTITSYIKINEILNRNLSTFLNILSFLGCTMTIYYTPVFLHDFLGVAMGRRLNNYIRVFACIPLINGVLYYVLPWSSIILRISNVVLLVSVSYSVILTFNQLKKLSTYKRNLIKIFVLLTVIALPFLFLDIFIERIPGIGSSFPYGILSFPLYYAVWNMFSLYFGYQEFGRMWELRILSPKKDNLIEKNSIDFFCNEYEITSREKEVIQLLVKGCSYNKISEELMISLSTTKSHVYNIYQKTNVKNKIELLFMIKNTG